MNSQRERYIVKTTSGNVEVHHYGTAVRIREALGGVIVAIR